MTWQLFSILLTVLIPTLALWDIGRRYLASGGQLSAHTAMLTAAHSRIDDVRGEVVTERRERRDADDALEQQTSTRVNSLAEALGKRIEQLTKDALANTIHLDERIEAVKSTAAADIRNICDAHDTLRSRLAKVEDLRAGLELHNDAQKQLAVEWLAKFREVDKKLDELVRTIDARVAGTLAQAGSVGSNGNYFRNPGG